MHFKEQGQGSSPPEHPGKCLTRRLPWAITTQQLSPHGNREDFSVSTSGTTIKITCFVLFRSRSDEELTNLFRYSLQKGLLMAGLNFVYGAQR